MVKMLPVEFVSVVLPTALLIVFIVIGDDDGIMIAEFDV
jgi:hypothetical protein